MALHDWFLTAAERGNPDTRIDDESGNAWTTGNAVGGYIGAHLTHAGHDVTALVHGAEYFPALMAAADRLEPGDWIHFTDWEGDADQLLAAGGPDVGTWLAGLARRGVAVRGLLWRSHPRQANLAEQPNMGFARRINEAGGEVLLDERVRRGGSHHQKLFVLRSEAHPDRDVAFVGGIDLAHGRRDDEHHLGDRQAVALAEQYGANPPWHDAQLRIEGPAVHALAWTFRERWDDRTPLDHRNPLRRVARAVVRQPRHPQPLPPPLELPPACGTHAVQVLRTYPAKRPPFPFAKQGERSIARANTKDIDRCWEAMRHHPSLHVVLVVPRFPDRDGAVTSRSARVARQDALRPLVRAAPERLLVCDLQNDAGAPVYVHAKVCIVDDVWMMVGSDNFNRRSWTHDSELSCAVVDESLDERAPHDPGGLGDGARRLARDTRLRLWREHLGRTPDDDGDLVDPALGFARFRQAADDLDAWYEAGARGERPPGHVRRHTPAPVPRSQAWWARRVARGLDDPDGRPRALRRAGWH